MISLCEYDGLEYLNVSHDSDDSSARSVDLVLCAVIHPPSFLGPYILYLLGLQGLHWRTVPLYYLLLAGFKFDPDSSTIVRKGPINIGSRIRRHGALLQIHG